VAYHDEEWGRPIKNDIELYELLTLEGAQVRLVVLLIILQPAAVVHAAYEVVRLGYLLQKCNHYCSSLSPLLQPCGLPRISTCPAPTM
jgi:hypothetical protein